MAINCTINLLSYGTGFARCSLSLIDATHLIGLSLIFKTVNKLWHVLHMQCLAAQEGRSPWCAHAVYAVGHIKDLLLPSPQPHAGTRQLVSKGGSVT